MSFSFIPAERDGRLNALIGALVFLVTFGVYAYCVTPTVPYWDSGEFIATSYILGVPHPPGTPLYVLIGRLFSLLPLATVAVRVNLLSSFSSAIAVLFTYLITVRVIRRSLGDEMAGAPWLAWLGGAVAAFFMAFSPTFWDNAIEAEVYGGACAIMTLCVWLALYWWDRQGQPQNDRFIWLILYILFLAIGIHLGTFLVFPCIYLLITMVRWQQVRKGWFWTSVIVFLVAATIRYLIIDTINDANPAIVDLSLAPPGVQTQTSLLFLVMALAVAWNMISVLGIRFAGGIVFLAVLGISVHLYLLVRAHLEPAINEGDPRTWKALKLMLLRDQYKPPEPNFRKASLWLQLNYMYLRYFGWQFQLGRFLGDRSYLIPVGLGIFGAIINYMREKKTFFLMFTLFLITGPFLVYYLNFKGGEIGGPAGEVRDRDYFFVSNFHFFAIWIGFGVAALVHAIGELLAKPAESPAGRRLHPVAYPVGALFLLASVMPLFAGQDNQNFHQHNRRGNFIAHDYAYNMLVGLKPNAIIFTNGDNDTFPLWYIQEVEHFRKDVRVLCLSLLNTDWCIKQARDQEPKVPIRLTDAEIAKLNWRYDPKTRQVTQVKDIMVHHIIQVNNWQRPIYLAVTVPDQMGLTKQLEMQGLVFEVKKDPPARSMDAALTLDNLEHKYRYRGFLDANGEWDDKVYKDDQSTNLLQNYGAAYVQLAAELGDEGKTDQALAVIDRVKKISPRFPGIMMALGLVYERLGRLDDAQKHFEAMLADYPNQAQILSRLGHIQALRGDTASALTSLQKSIQLDPASEFNPYAELVNIYYKRYDSNTCVTLLQQWLAYHPEDSRARETLKMIQTTVNPARPAITPGAGAPSGTAGSPVNP